MSQEEPSDSQQSGTDAPWPGNITNCLSETQSLFTDQQESDEIGSIYADVETALTAGNEARRRELDVTRDRLRALSRQAESYRLSAQRPPNAPSAYQHESKLVELDTKKYSLAKNIGDLEQGIASTEVQLSRTRDEAARLEREDPIKDSESQMGDALKLGIFRSLGLLPIEEGDKYTGMLLRSNKSQDAHVLHNGKLSSYEYASQTWKLLAS